MFSRVQTDVLLNVLQNGENKRGEERRVTLVSKQKFGPLTLYVLMDFFIDIDRIKMGLSYYRFTGHIFQSLMFYVPKD